MISCVIEWIVLTTLSCYRKNGYNLKISRLVPETLDGPYVVLLEQVALINLGVFSVVLISSSLVL